MHRHRRALGKTQARANRGLGSWAGLIFRHGSRGKKRTVPGWRAAGSNKLDALPGRSPKGQFAIELLAVAIWHASAGTFLR